MGFGAEILRQNSIWVGVSWSEVVALRNCSLRFSRGLVHSLFLEKGEDTAFGSSALQRTSNCCSAVPLTCIFAGTRPAAWT